MNLYVHITNVQILNRSITQGLETNFYMHKYTELLTFLTKIRFSEYKHIQGIELHGIVEENYKLSDQTDFYGMVSPFVAFC